LWLGGVVSPRRDKQLIRQLAKQIHEVALCRPVILAVDGLPSYVKAFQQAFRAKMPRYEQKERSCFVSWPDVGIVCVIKQQTSDGLHIRREIVQGCPQLIKQLRIKSQGSAVVINTAYIERLNAKTGQCRRRLQVLFAYPRQCHKMYLH
jgi:hypothetical protein